MSNLEKIKKELKQFPESEWQGVVAGNNTVQQKGKKYFIFAGGLNPICSGTFSEVMQWIEDQKFFQSQYDELA